MEKREIINELLELFRQQGYEGLSISAIAQATGLGKSSLYHHFPDGKEQMAREVLSYIDATTKQYFIAPLKGEGTAEEKLTRMSKNIDDFYDGGRKSCVVDALTLGHTTAPFHDSVSGCVDAWIEAMAAVAVEAGVNKKSARERAESVLITIEGSLIVCRALRNYQLFKREVKNIPRLMLSGQPATK